MTRNEQKHLVKSLVRNVLRDLLAKADQWPEEWDGHELRRLVANAYSEVVFVEMSRTRLRDFRNACLTRNLP